MKSVTLTKQMRQDILNSIIEKWKDKNKEPEIKEEEHKFAMKLWNNHFKKDKKIFLNQELNTFISIVPVVDVPNTDVEITYFIRNLDGDIVFSEGERRTIIEKEGFVKIFPTIGFEVGEYIVGMEMTYSGGFASSSEYFEVVDNPFLAPFSDDILLILESFYVTLIWVLHSL